MSSDQKKKILIRRPSHAPAEPTAPAAEPAAPRQSVSPFAKAKEEMEAFHQALGGEQVEDVRGSEGGSIVEGTVVQVREDAVYVDIGYKAEGLIPADEFREMPSVGDKVRVAVLSGDDSRGNIRVSKRSADAAVARRVLMRAHESGESVEGLVVRSVKGGFEVDVGLNAFLPLTQADIRPVKNSDLIGQTFDFRVERIERGRKGLNVVVTRRPLLEQAREGDLESFYANHEVGTKVTGKIRNVRDFGVFVNLGPLDGLIHVSDLSWERVRKPSDTVKEGDEITAVITEIDRENEKISLSVKALSEDPWAVFVREHEIGERITGTVTGLTDYGAFVKVSDGVEGLIHISEMSWTRNLSHPKELVRKGDSLECQILEIDTDTHRLSLGLRQVMPNPWDELEESCPPGTVVTGKVVRVVQAGVAIKINAELEGFLPASEIDWSKKRVDPTKMFEENEDVDVVLLEIDQERQRITLGRRQLTDNPYAVFARDYPKGSDLEGEVVRIEEYGAFVRVADGMEGLIHISQLSRKRVDKVEDVVSVGDKIHVAIRNVDIQNQKISLSRRDFEIASERREVQRYTQGDSEESGSATLGSLFDLDKLIKN